jgi:hypothetical protein
MLGVLVEVLIVLVALFFLVAGVGQLVVPGGYFLWQGEGMGSLWLVVFGGVLLLAVGLSASLGGFIKWQQLLLSRKSA